MLLEVASPGRWHLDPKCSKAEMGSSGESQVGVNRKGSLGDQSSKSSTVGWKNERKAVVRNDSAETRHSVSCQEMEKDNNKSWRSWASSRAP